MPEFPSEEWCRWAITLLNEDPEAAGAAKGWDGDFGEVTVAVVSFGMVPLKEAVSTDTTINARKTQFMEGRR